MVEKMKILSLFDGMSCGRIALERAEIPVEHYYAAEIDKHAIKISLKNYPDIIQLGNVSTVRQMAQSGVFGKIDLLIGGSPCQGFSFAGKQLAFNDPRSALFFEYVWTLEALRKHNPNIKFLLENVKMKKEYINMITEILGIEPVFINSNLVSAQNRQRLYWANWSISQPDDKGIFLKDILQDNFSNDVLLDNGQLNRLRTSTDLEKRFSVINSLKAACMTARQYSNWKGTFIAVGQIQPQPRNYKELGLPRIEGLEFRKDGKSNTLLAESNLKNILDFGTVYRRLTPIEYERLQTMPDDYTLGVSNSQRYKMLGNSWTVDVIAHIFRGMPK